ncbi:MAG TPA: peptidoglycan DD-metalloendopeptidase family protein [Candidatus Binataceae bacterium]|nr:peptidoglycan DD-metalloendopeptidase family protein [Candidatus Binataceae bacterium]
MDVSKYKPRLSVSAGFILTAMLAGCFSAAPQPPAARSSAALPAGSRATHEVARGETVYRIAHEYGVSPERLMQANGLGDPRDLRVGQMLVIPSYAAASDPGFANEWVIPPRADRQLAWPVAAGKVSSPFGIRNGVMHDGVDIVAPAGTPVSAADDGVVIYCGHMRGYGNVVILQHSQGYVTVYGHNQRNLVRDGDRVARGEQIAELGSTGRASAPNLHFEVRCDNRPENPLAYLPVPQPSSGISFARYNGN